MLFLARKIRVRARIILVNGQRYEAAGYSNIHEFFSKADLRLGESVDIASRAKDGTPNWQRTETMKIAGEVISVAKKSHGTLAPGRCQRRQNITDSAGTKVKKEGCKALFFI